MAVQHLRLVCGSLAALTLLTLSQIRGAGPRPVPSLQQLFVLNSALSIAACSLLFCSTGFAIAGWLLLHRTPKHVRAGLHFTDASPTRAEQQQQERGTALQTLAAANWACSTAYVGLFYALSALRCDLESDCNHSSECICFDTGPPQCMSSGPCGFPLPSAVPRCAEYRKADGVSLEGQEQWSGSDPWTAGGVRAPAVGMSPRPPVWDCIAVV